MLVHHAVPAAQIAVIGRVDHQRVVGKIQPVQGVKNPADLRVQQADRAQIARNNGRPIVPRPVGNAPGFPHPLLNVRLAGQRVGKRGPRRNVAGRVLRGERVGNEVGQVRLARVPADEKRAIRVGRRGALYQPDRFVCSPGKARLAGRDVLVGFAPPAIGALQEWHALRLPPRVVVRFGNVLVEPKIARAFRFADVPFAHVAQKIAGPMERLAPGRQIRPGGGGRFGVVIDHGVVARGPAAVQKRVAGRNADRAWRKSVREVGALARHPVQVRRGNQQVAVRADAIEAVLVRVEEKNVCGCHKRC